MSSLSAIAALALARVLERKTDHGKATVTDGTTEVILIVRKCDPGATLKTHHKKLLDVLTTDPRSPKTLCRMAGYSVSSLGLVRRTLNELVKAGKATRCADGYSVE